MNPMVSSRSGRGDVRRFEPPWGETVCVVTLDTGHWGLGLTAHAGVVVPMINDYLGPLVVDERIESIDDIAEVWDPMSTVAAAHIGAAGAASYAISAIDLALFDALGKHAQQPVYDLLGGGAHDRIAMYATGTDLAKASELGFSAFKIPCPWLEPGPAGVARAVGAVEAARSIVGDADPEIWRPISLAWTVLLRTVPPAELWLFSRQVALW